MNNKVTLNTRIRAAIMRQLGEKYLENNRGASYKVRGYESRPSLLVTPPAASKTRPRTFTFIDAVTTLPAHFSDDNLIQIFSIVGNNNRGMLRRLFLVLDDDDHDRCLDLVKKYHEDRLSRSRDHRSDGRSASGSGPHSASGFTSVGTHAVHFSGPGAGMETEAHVRKLLSASRLVQTSQAQIARMMGPAVPRSWLQKVRATPMKVGMYISNRPIAIGSTVIGHAADKVGWVRVFISVD